MSQLKVTHPEHPLVQRSVSAEGAIERAIHPFGRSSKTRWDSVQGISDWVADFPVASVSIFLSIIYCSGSQADHSLSQFSLTVDEFNIANHWILGWLDSQFSCTYNLSFLLSLIKSIYTCPCCCFEPGTWAKVLDTKRPCW